MGMERFKDFDKSSDTSGTKRLTHVTTVSYFDEFAKQLQVYMMENLNFYYVS
jgi:hypothetical protein